MKLLQYLIATLLFIGPLSALANSIDNDLERANQLIETSPKESIELCQEISKKKLSEKQLTSLLQIQGNAHFALGDNTKAKDAFRKAILKASTAKDTILWASALSDLGVTYRVSERLDSAILCYNQALSLLEQIDAPNEEAHLLTSIAVFYANQGRFDESIKYGRRAFETAKKSQDINTIMYAGQTLGLVLYINGEKKEGLTIEREMVTIAEKLQQPRYILKAYAAIIEMHHKEGCRDSVNHYIAKGEQTLKLVPEASVEAIGFLEECFIVLTDEGRYRESLDIQHKILNMRGAGTFMPFNKLYPRIALNYKGLGDIQRMGDAYERAIAITDSLHQLEIDHQLSELDVKYETAQRELKIANLKATNSQQQMIIVTICISTALLIVCLYAFFTIKRTRLRKTLELKALHDQLEAIDKERGRLAAELHDGICSDLTGVSLLMQTQHSNPSELANMISTICNDVRTISHALMPPRLEGLTLEQLLINLQVKSNNLINIKHINENELTPADKFQLYRIAQEWTNNILKYSDATRIDISLDYHLFLITDNGAPAQFPKTQGIGIENIRNRALSIGATSSITYENGYNCLNILLKNS